MFMMSLCQMFVKSWEGTTDKWQNFNINYQVTLVVSIKQF